MRLTGMEPGNEANWQGSLGMRLTGRGAWE